MALEKNDKPTVPVSKKTLTPTFPATIAHVIDSFRLAINMGHRHGVRVGQRFLIYALSSEDILDPETKESLGRLEIVRGTGRVVHLQESLATIESDRHQRRIIRRTTGGALSSILGGTVEEEGEGDLIPFEEPKVGDKARPI